MAKIGTLKQGENEEIIYPQTTYGAVCRSDGVRLDEEMGNVLHSETVSSVESVPLCVNDVKLGGTSIVDNGVATIPIADGFGKSGAVNLSSAGGVKWSNSLNAICIDFANESYIATRSSGNKPIIPYYLDYAVKCAMCDGKGAAWNENEKKLAQNRLGLNKEWSLKGSILTTDPVSVDFSNCTEFFLIGSITANGASDMFTNIGRLIYNMTANATRYYRIHYMNQPISGVEPVCAKFSTVDIIQGDNLTAYTQGTQSSAVGVSGINKFYFSPASVITNIDIKIYAR